MNNSLDENNSVEVEPWQLPWQKDAWLRFEQSYSNKNLHHAWIIEGDEDYATKEFVLAIAKLVNCSEITNNRPCNSCTSCHQINNGTYADFYEIKCLPSKTQIGVDQIREVSSTLVKTAYSGGYRVVTVVKAELMNQASANAFLKTLEEPGEKTLILLQTLTPSRLLATLRSRCQQLSLTATKSSAIEAWLKQQFSSDNAEIANALNASGYKPLQALNFLQDGLIKQRQEFFTELDNLLQLKIKLSQFESNNSLEFSLMLSWMEQYLFEYFYNYPLKRSQLEAFYSVFQEIRLQSIQTRDADKPLLLREIIVKWIALSAKLRHSN